MFNTSVWKLIFLKETIFPSEGCVKTLWWCTGMSFYNIRNKAKIKIVTFISTSSRSSLITYIHNWSLQPFSQVYNLYSHRTYVVCVNFMHGWRDLQFIIDSERQIFERLFMAILFTPRVFTRNLLRRSRQRNIFIFSFWCLTWYLNSDLMPNNPKHYLLDFDD